MIQLVSLTNATLWGFWKHIQFYPRSVPQPDSHKEHSPSQKAGGLRKGWKKKGAMGRMDGRRERVRDGQDMLLLIAVVAESTAETIA